MTQKENPTEEKSLILFSQELMAPEQLKALNIFVTKKIPKDAIQQRPGPDGKALSYLSHVWVTEQLQIAFGNAIDFNVLEWQVFNDQEGGTLSVAVRCQLKLRVIIDPALRKFPSDPMYFEREVTETGVFHKQIKKMPTAMAVASAASRGLCRCVARMFGVGLDLYKNDEPMSFADVWKTLGQFANNQKRNVWTKEFQEEFGKQLAEQGITRDNMEERFLDAYALLSHILKGD